MKKKIVVILIIIVIGAGVALVKVRKHQRAIEKPAHVLPVVVKTVQLEKKPVRLTLPAMGVVGSELSTTLSTKISGTIKKILKQEGDTIHKGELLAEINASDLRAKKQGLVLKKQGIKFKINSGLDTIKALETSLNSAKETHNRTKELYKVKGASVEQLRQEEANLAKIEAQLSTARNTISTLKKEQGTLDQNIKEIQSLIKYAAINSPVNGTLSKRMVMPGDMAMPGKPLFRIASGEGLYINLFLPNTIQSNRILFKGQAFKMTSKNQATATGLVQYIASVPSDMGLVENQYVNVQVIVYEEDTCLVPMDGILNVGGKSFVFEMDGDQAQPVQVKIVTKGVEGLIVDKEMNGKTVITAKPDILLRISAGVPVQVIKNENKYGAIHNLKRTKG